MIIFFFNPPKLVVAGMIDGSVSITDDAIFGTYSAAVSIFYGIYSQML